VTEETVYREKTEGDCWLGQAVVKKKRQGSNYPGVSFEDSVFQALKNPLGPFRPSERAYG
jgi:hypothetical protein